ncbi:MAG TPA: thioredoxin fold domain-containing protein [Campylobacterales bacterium]|nr:thioredoxin fold domain-containing protein [Campylobacterales bacterium]
MLKKSLFLILFAISAFGAQIEWSLDYKAALEKAKNENKPILLMLSQPGCPACAQMKETVLKKDELVINEISSKFVAVEVNILKESWNKKFRAFATPTFYFLDKNENKIGRQFVGGADGEEFLKILKDVQTKR